MMRGHMRKGHRFPVLVSVLVLSLTMAAAVASAQETTVTTPATTATTTDATTSTTPAPAAEESAPAPAADGARDVREKGTHRAATLPPTTTKVRLKGVRKGRVTAGKRVKVAGTVRPLPGRPEGDDHPQPRQEDRQARDRQGAREGQGLAARPVPLLAEDGRAGHVPGPGDPPQGRQLGLVEGRQPATSGSATRASRRATAGRRSRR